MEHQRAVAQLKALGEANRLGLFLQLARGEMGGSDLLRGSGLSQPSLSRHVRVLREAGVILERWAGRNAFYRLSEEPMTMGIAEILSGGTAAWTVSRGEGQAEAGNMSKYESEAAASSVSDEGDATGAPPAMEDWLL